MNDVLIEQARQVFDAAQSIIIVSHERPDGDAIGSMLGLGLALQAKGKTVQMVSPDGVHAGARHLEGVEQIRRQRNHQGDAAYDCIVVVDCSDLARVGGVLDGLPAPDVLVDHHVTNQNFARLNLVDAQAAATSEILADLLPRWNLPITSQVAAALMTGVLTDTIGFRTPSTRPNTLRIAAMLMEAGADIAGLYRPSLLQRSFEAVRYWGAGLSKVQREGRMLWTSLSLRDRQEAGFPGRDDADLINILSVVDKFDIYVLFIEQADSTVKVSWRSQPGFDVSQLAASFGGGGHKAAAGASISGNLAEVQNNVLNATRALCRQIS